MGGTPFLHPFYYSSLDSATVAFLEASLGDLSWADTVNQFSEASIAARGSVRTKPVTTQPNTATRVVQIHFSTHNIYLFFASPVTKTNPIIKRSRFLPSKKRYNDVCIGRKQKIRLCLINCLYHTISCFLMLIFSVP